MTPTSMNAPLLSMRVVARMTGLTPDTIRVWERRYRAVTPRRTTGNARRYSEDDVQRLRLLHEATTHGLPIHDAAQLADAELRKLLDNTEQNRAPYAGPNASKQFERWVHDYLHAIQRFDSTNAARLMQRAAVLLDRDDFIFQVIVPILRAVGDRWHQGTLTVAHEHLVSNQLRAILQTDLRFTQALPGARRVLVGTVAGERHEFGALMGALIAASRGFEVVYLGADLPWQDLNDAMHRTDVDLVLLGVLHDLDPAHMEAARRGLDELAAGGKPVWLGLPPTHLLKHQTTVARTFDSFDALDAALCAWGPNR